MTIGLALFDDGLSMGERQNIVANIRSMEGSKEPLPMVRVNEADLDNRNVPSFIMKNTGEIPGSAGNQQRVSQSQSCPVGARLNVSGWDKANRWP